MTKPRVLLYSDRVYEIDEYVASIQKANAPIELMVCRNAAEASSCIAEAEVIFGVHLDGELYASATKLRWVQSMWAGVEGLLRSPIANDVTITKPFNVFGPYICHYVFGHLLSLCIDTRQSWKNQQECNWSPYQIRLLTGLRLGVAGMGDIGSEVARVGAAMGMTVVGLNRDGREHPLTTRMYSMEQVQEFARDCDVVVLTLPATPLTRELFNRDVLTSMKPNAILINTGRGVLIEDSALIDRLRQRRLGAAVLDVFQEEPLPQTHPYWQLENCIVTPHIAGPSLPAEITGCFLDNLSCYLEGRPLHGVVSRSRGY